MKLTSFALGLCAILLTLAITVPSEATVMVEVSMEDMIREAKVIAVGQVVRTGNQAIFKNGELKPYTVSFVRVNQWLKGAPKNKMQTLRIREFGGKLGNIQTTIVGTPQYKLGEEVLVFAEADPNDARHVRTFAMTQGKFSILRGVPGVPSVAKRDTHSVGLAKWAKGKMLVSHGRQDALQLDGFVDFIKQTLLRYGNGSGPTQIPGSVSPTNSTGPSSSSR